MEYFERNFRRVLQGSPCVLASVHRERVEWALSTIRIAGAHKGGGEVSSPVSMDGTRWDDLSNFFRVAGSSIGVSELARLMRTTQIGIGASAGQPSCLDNTRMPEAPTDLSSVGNMSVTMFFDTLNRLTHYNRTMLIRKRMRSTFLLRRYRLAVAATKFIQSTLTKEMPFSPNPPSVGTHCLSVECPHYTPHDRLTGNENVNVNSTRLAWSVDSPQFKRGQFGEFAHYTVRTVRQAEQHLIEEERCYDRLVRKAHRVAREEARISTATGSLAARLRMRGKKNRVGGAAASPSALPFLNTLIERHRPGASGPPLIMSDKLATAHEDSEDASHSDSSLSSSSEVPNRFPSYSIIAPTMPRGKARRLLKVDKGALQSVGDTPEHLERLKSTNPRLYYHRLYAARSAISSAVIKRNPTVDMFRERQKGANSIKTIGFNGQHIALEVAIKWRIRVESRLFLRRMSENEDSVTGIPGVEETGAVEQKAILRRPFSMARARFLIL